MVDDCAATSQPHLLATTGVGFATDHVTNHADPGVIYMGEVVWSFLGPDHIQTHWWSF
ncbi:MAG: hypothetical protein MK074_00520 [Phycisphaerales bacterium]|nr:hypothetical protein [Phycisphaerales bacterium]